MRCTLESKRGDGGKMKNKKEGLFIQCIVCSLLPLITLFIPYLKFGISVPLLGKVMEQLTGMDLLKVMGNVNNLANSELADYLGSDFFSGIKTYIILMVLVIFVIPLILFIASAVMHGLAMKSGQFTKTLAIMPGLALIFSAGGLLLCQAIIKSKIKDAMSTLADVSGDLSSLFGDSVSNSVSSMIKFQGEIGFWLLVIIAIVLVVEDLVLSSKEGVSGQMQKTDPFVEDAIYAQKRQGSSVSVQTPKRPITTWSDSDAFKNPIYTKTPGGAGPQPSNTPKKRTTTMTGEVTQKSQVPSGMIIGIRGEYNGAQIQIFNGEKIYIGRSSESNLVLSNKKASRKHCSIAYDAKEDKYSIVFLPFGLGLKELDRFDVVILCPHLKVELDRALKKQTIDKPLYLLPPKMYGLMKFDEIIVDIEDVMKMYQENPVVPVKFPGEDNLLRITRGVAYRHAHPLK